ncbi:hypothetical protein ACHAWF_002049 [Thalassiosira exigua]
MAPSPPPPAAAASNPPGAALRRRRRLAPLLLLAPLATPPTPVRCAACFATVGTAGRRSRPWPRRPEEPSLRREASRPASFPADRRFFSRYAYDDVEIRILAERSGRVAPKKTRCCRSFGENPHGKVLVSMGTAQRMFLAAVARLRKHLGRATTKLLPLLMALAVALSSLNARASDSWEGATPHLHHRNNLQLGPQRTRSVYSIRTEPPPPCRPTGNRRRREAEKKRAVKRISLLVVLATVAASAYRASLRTSRIVRSASPFGRIRNASALGNGVSVIRVCAALGFDADGGDDFGTEGRGRGEERGAGGMDGLLKRLDLEERALYEKVDAASRGLVREDDARVLRQKALGTYLSNVASMFLNYDEHMRYGSVDSVRVPFPEEAVREFRRTTKEERAAFEKLRRARSTKSRPRRGTSYVLATMVLVIKGDRTATSPPFGIVRRRDVARALARVAKDAVVDDCLIGAEVATAPDARRAGDEDVGGGSQGLVEAEILDAFPDLVPLT